VVEAVLGGPGVAVVAEELEAATELEAEVEAGGVVGGQVAGRDQEAAVADEEGLKAMAGGEVDALTDGG